MSTPSVRAASRTFVPFGTVTVWPSITSETMPSGVAGCGGGCGALGGLAGIWVTVGPSFIALPADHVDHAEDRHDVSDEVVVDQLACRRQVDERWRSDVGLVRT